MVDTPGEYSKSKLVLLDFNKVGFYSVKYFAKSQGLNLKNRSILITFLVLFSGHLFASDAYIKTDSSIGQGFLFERNNICYLGTPKHVVEDANSINFMTADRKNHDAKIEKLFEVDLAILKVKNPKACSFKQPEGKTRLRSLLKIYRDGILKSRLSDGSILQTKITITGIDETEYLQITPQKKKDILKQGYSGSILYVADQPAGMLLEVDDENIGYVYRQDALSNKLKSYFQQDNKNITQKSKKISNIPSLGNMQGDLAKDKTKEFQFSWQKNSPVTLSFKKTKGNLQFTLFILDEEGDQQFQQNFATTGEYEFAFTPTTTGVYTIRLVGYQGYGKFDIKIGQLTLDAELRGAGNVVEVGDSMSGLLANKSIAEYKYAGQENSPITLSFKKTKGNLQFTLFILDEEGDQQFQQNFATTGEYEFAFTPTTTGVYTIRLVGYQGYGKFDIKIGQLTLDAELRGAGNVVEVGDSMSGLLANKSIAEYKYAGQENSPITLSFKKAKGNLQFTLFILDEEGDQQFQQNFATTGEYEFAFTPTTTGVYTIRLVGYQGYGKFKIEVKK
jgi:hypothetical protein